jgi:hypothetical protein
MTMAADHDHDGQDANPRACLSALLEREVERYLTMSVVHAHLVFDGRREASGESLRYHSHFSISLLTMTNDERRGTTTLECTDTSSNNRSTLTKWQQLVSHHSIHPSREKHCNCRTNDDRRPNRHARKPRQFFIITEIG